MPDQTIQTLADEAYSWFTKSTRADGVTDYWHVKDGAPEWLTDLCREAHGDMLPDDFRYQFIVDALIALSENLDLDMARDSLEPDVYTSRLTAWLGSHSDRIAYTDEARGDMPDAESITDLIAWGQLQEMREVFESVLNFLQDQVAGIDA